jgi:hypothetical protein
MAIHHSTPTARRLMNRRLQKSKRLYPAAGQQPGS